MTSVAVQVRFASTTGLAKDIIENNWSFTTPTPFDSTMQSNLETAIHHFYDLKPTGVAASLANYMSGIIVRTSVVHEMRFYDIGSTIHGEPHGAPVGNALFGLASVASNANDLPNQDACVMSFRGIPTGSLIPVAEAVPTDDRAQDEGAPATHPGFSRPLERVTGRLYLGPFNQDANQTAALAEPRVATTLRQTIVAAAKAFLIELGSTIVWGIWSRMAGAIVPVVEGWIDDRWDAQRRRESAATNRLFFP